MENDKDEFLSMNINYALIVRGDIKDIQRLKEMIIDEFGDTINIIYQKTSLDKLYIGGISPSGNRGEHEPEE